MPCPVSIRLPACRALRAGVSVALLLQAVPAAWIGAEERLVTLRDGSYFQVTAPPLTLELVESGGSGAEVVSTPLPLDGIARAEFSLTSGQEKFAAILRTMAGLDAEAFVEREHATLWLLRNTAGFRPLLSQRAVSGALPPESRWRLRAVLDRIPDEALAADRRPFDRVYPDEGGTRDGDLGNWEIPAAIRGATLPLTRVSVASISRGGAADGTPAPESVRRLESPDDPAFAFEARTLDFETDSEGLTLKVGNNISTRFIGDGVIFSTSAADSFVSVNLYEVSGPSRGFSAATHDPLYEGTVTIRFCMPGNRGVPAGVQAVGLWLAVVRENGTRLQALDAFGEIIAEIATTGPPSEFLGLWSPTPIHALRVIPNPGIDPNYTIDDLVFTPLRPVDGLGVEEYPTLSFRSGDRVVCSDFEIEAGEIAFRPLSFEAVTLRAPIAEIHTLYPPLATGAAAFGASDYWIELTDGTRLLASSANDHALPKIPGTHAASLAVAALWGQSRIPSPPPKNHPAYAQWIPGNAVFLVDERDARLIEARLGAHWIEPVAGEFPDGLDSTYAESPTVWFQRPVAPAPGSGQLRFPNGERIILGGSGKFRLKALTRNQVTIEREGREWTFPFTETSALHLPEP